MKATYSFGSGLPVSYLRSQWHASSSNPIGGAGVRLSPPISTRRTTATRASPDLQSSTCNQWYMLHDWCMRGIPGEQCCECQFLVGWKLSYTDSGKLEVLLHVSSVIRQQLMQLMPLRFASVIFFVHHLPISKKFLTSRCNARHMFSTVTCTC